MKKSIVLTVHGNLLHNRPMEKKKREANLTLYLGKNASILQKALHEEADRQRRSISEIVIMAIEDGPSKELQEAFRCARKPKLIIPESA